MRGSSSAFSSASLASSSSASPRQLLRTTPGAPPTLTQCRGPPCRSIRRRGRAALCSARQASASCISGELMPTARPAVQSPAAVGARAPIAGPEPSTIVRARPQHLREHLLRAAIINDNNNGDADGFCFLDRLPSLILRLLQRPTLKSEDPRFSCVQQALRRLVFFSCISAFCSPFSTGPSRFLLVPGIIKIFAPHTLSSLAGPFHDNSHVCMCVRVCRV